MKLHCTPKMLAKLTKAAKKATEDLSPQLLVLDCSRPAPLVKAYDEDMNLLKSIPAVDLVRGEG